MRNPVLRSFELTLPLGNLRSLSYDYDVRDGAWVHEQMSLPCNAGHIGIHLSQTIARRGFKPAVVGEVIVPDALAHYFRLERALIRASSMGVVEAVATDILGTQADAELNDTYYSTRSATIPEARFKRAADILLSLEERRGHPEAQADVVEAAPRNAALAMVYLAGCATEFVEMYEINPEESLAKRLDGLRTRFGVDPQK